MIGKSNYNNYNINPNSQYYRGEQNNNTGDLSKYNFTNTKPVPLKPYNPNHQNYYNKKPQTSHLLNRPVDKKELDEAKMALQSLNARIKRNKTDTITTNKNVNVNRTNTAQEKRRPIQVPQMQQQQQQQQPNQPFKKQAVSFQPNKNKTQIAPMNNNNNNINNTNVNPIKRMPVIYKDESHNNIQQQYNNNYDQFNNNNINYNNNVYPKRNVNETKQYSQVNNNNNQYPLPLNQYNSNNNMNVNYNNQHLYNDINNNDNENDSRKLDLGHDNQSSNKEYMNAEQGEPTYPCPDCGRRFIDAVYHKHIKICKNVFQKKRKAFDMKQARILDEEHANIIKQAELQEKKQNKTKQQQQQLSSKPIKAVPKWKRQSEEFRRIISGGTTSGGGGTTGGSFGQMQAQPSYNDDYTLCQFCNRRYNEQAYNKHLPGCERRFKEAQIKNKNKSSSSNNVNQNNIRGYYGSNSSGSKNIMRRK